MNMRKVNLDTWIQLLGMLGVLGGFVFVGLEMQQSQRIALSSQQQERAHKWIDIGAGILEAGYDFDAIMRFDSSIENPEQELARRNFYHASFFIAENDFNQYKNGFLSEFDFQTKVIGGLEFLLEQCDLRLLADYRKRWFSSDFLELINSTEDPCI